MNVELLKEPAALFTFGCILTMIFLFVETRIRGEKKPYKDYVIYGIYVGLLLLFVQYITTSGKTKTLTLGGDKFLIDRFPA
jgi:hypothetical protein